MMNPKPWQIMPRIFWPGLFLSLFFGLCAWANPWLLPERFTTPFLRDPTALKTVHLAALGQLGLLFLVVTVQALPVLFHLPHAKRGLSLAGQGLFALGVLALVSFFAGWRNAFLLALAVGSLASGWALLFWQARRLAAEGQGKSFAWKGLEPAFAYLGVMIGLGGLMAVGILRPLLPQDPLATIQLHLHIGLWGFATLAIFGFLPKLLRLFQASTGYAGWPLRAAFTLVHAGLALLALDWLGLGSPWPARAASLLLLAAAVLFTLQIYLLLRAARSFRLDSSLATQCLGLAFLLMAATLDVWLLWGHGDWRLQSACLALGLGGWVGAVLQGSIQRIAAVLAWFERFLPLAEGMAVPTAWDLVDPRLAWSVPLLHGSGTVALAAGLALGSPGLIRAGGALGCLALLSTTGLVWGCLKRGKAQPYPPGAHPFGDWVREQATERDLASGQN